MQANTASTANEPVNFPNFSVQNKRSDPFTIRNGQYVGHDGFVVPKNFDEFYERFPQYVRNWVRRHADPSAHKEDLEDWTQDLLFHLRHLPSTSKHREAGKEDIIQTFDPHKHYGANQARFQHYVNLCLRNKFRSLQSSRMKDALSQRGNVSLDSQTAWDDPCAVDDEYCHAHSEHLQRAANASEEWERNRALVREFVDFVHREAPDALLAIEAITETGTHEEVAQKIGTVRRVHLRLHELGRSFLNRERPQDRRCALRRSEMEAKTSYPNTHIVPADEFSTPALWSRVDFYVEVWEQPLVKLAKKYGVSDVRLGKVCRKLKIPHPGRGYWAKRAVGQAVEQVPLPQFGDAPVVRQMKTKSGPTWQGRWKKV